MKRSVFILVFTIFAAFAAPAQVNVGMTDTASYYPLLRGRRVAVLANQTSVAELPWQLRQWAPRVRRKFMIYTTLTAGMTGLTEHSPTLGQTFRE